MFYASQVKPVDLTSRAVLIFCFGFISLSQIGEGVTAFQGGERVVPVIYWSYLVGKGQGAWQDFIEVAETDLIFLPESISDEAASLFIISPWTVYGLLKDLAIPRGEFLLQTAGGSVIGR